MKTSETISLFNLPGVHSGVVDAVQVTCRTGATEMLKKGQSIIASGNNGALHVWQDDAGQYCCQFCQFGQPIETSTYKYLAAADEWLRIWFPKLKQA